MCHDELFPILLQAVKNSGCTVSAFLDHDQFSLSLITIQIPVPARCDCTERPKWPHPAVNTIVMLGQSQGTAQNATHVLGLCVSVQQFIRKETLTMSGHALHTTAFTV
jgi:hypothetical protein